MDNQFKPLSVAEALEACIEFNVDRCAFDKKARIYKQKSERKLRSKFDSDSALPGFCGFNANEHCAEMLKAALLSGKLIAYGYSVSEKPEPEPIRLPRQHLSVLTFWHKDNTAWLGGKPIYTEVEFIPAELDRIFDAPKKRGPANPFLPIVEKLYIDQEHSLREMNASQAAKKIMLQVKIMPNAKSFPNNFNEKNAAKIIRDFRNRQKLN